MNYLFITKEPGVLEYIGNRLFRKEENLYDRSYEQCGGILRSGYLAKLETF